MNYYQIGDVILKNDGTDIAHIVGEYWGHLEIKLLSMEGTEKALDSIMVREEHLIPEWDIIASDSNYLAKTVYYDMDLYTYCVISNIVKNPIGELQVCLIYADDISITLPLTVLVSRLVLVGGI